MALDLAQSTKSQPIPTQRSKHKDPLVKIVRVVDETVRREKALDFGGCTPATSGKKSEPTSKRAKSRAPVQLDPKEALAELVGKLRKKLDPKVVAAPRRLETYTRLATRTLSPLRLPDPPSRLFVEVIEIKA